MARENRLFLTQDDYLDACIRIANFPGISEYRLCSWGLSRVTDGSRIATLLHFLRLKPDVEIVIGLQDLGMAMKVANIVRQYSRIKWRFSSDTHAKYFLWKRKNYRTNQRSWGGFLGSCNLTDSKIWNIGYELPTYDATKLANAHEAKWRESVDMMLILKRMNGGLQQLMTTTIRQPNDTGNSGVLPTQPWRK